MYSSTITIRECNIKTPAQNREKRDKCGETENERGKGGGGGGWGECGSEGGTRDGGRNKN